jgi:hypothetical protein
MKSLLALLLILASCGPEANDGWWTALAVGNPFPARTRDAEGFTIVRLGEPCLEDQKPCAWACLDCPPEAESCSMDKDGYHCNVESLEELQELP